MIVPRNRLLFWTAMGVPFTVVGATVPWSAGLAVAFWLALAFVALGDALAGLRKSRAIGVRLPEVTRFSKDREGSISIEMVNEAGLDGTLRVGLPLPEHIVSPADFLDVALPAGGHTACRVPWRCTPRRRGSYTLEKVHVETPSPLGLWDARATAAARGELRVYPNLMRERNKMAAMFLNRGSFGVHAQRAVGKGREFEQLRDYIHGDSYEDVHWKATAKRGKPVTKMFQIERTQEVYCLVDASRLAARESGGERLIERFLTATLVLGLVAERQGDLFGLATFGDKVHKFIRAGSGRGHYGACRDAIYMQDASLVSPDFEALFSFVRVNINRRALLVVLTDLGDPVIAESFCRSVDLVRGKHVILVNAVRPPEAAELFSRGGLEDTDSLYRRLAGHVTWAALREMEKNLRRRGVGFRQVDEAGMAAAIVSQYMEVKRRQLI